MFLELFVNYNPGEAKLNKINHEEQILAKIYDTPKKYIFQRVNWNTNNEIRKY